jgi:hypothetical protein
VLADAKCGETNEAWVTVRSARLEFFTEISRARGP